MALTDQDMQELQAKVLEQSKIGEDNVFKTDSGNYYKVINAENGTTQALAVVPVDNNKGGNPDYSQTSIVVAGTISVNERQDLDAITSGIRAIRARGSMTPQYQEISDFYDQTEKKIKKHQGAEISNMSGFSQSGPPIAKKAAEEALEDKTGKKVIKITNFMDWGSVAALKKGTYWEDNDITAREKKYIDKHSTSYSDAGKDITSGDGSGGKIAYGKVRTVEGKKHSPSFPRIKANKLDIDYYVKKGQFASGMTEAQVIEVAKKKAQKGKTDYKDYVKDYKKAYGNYAKPAEEEEPDKKKNKSKTVHQKTSTDKKADKDTKSDKDKSNKTAKIKSNRAVEVKSNKTAKIKSNKTVKIKSNRTAKISQTKSNRVETLDKTASQIADNRKKAKALYSQIVSSGGSRRILLRQELVNTVAQTASLKAGSYEEEIKAKLSEVKADAETELSEMESKIRGMQRYLSDGEVSELLNSLTLETVWDEGEEAADLKAVGEYKAKLEHFSATAAAGAQRLKDTDQEGAQLFI